MFRASDVQIDLPPVFIGFTRHEGLFVVGVHISQIVCAGAGETGHGIQFEGISFRSMPLFGPTQRRFSGFGRQIFVDFGKLQRKVPVCRRDTVDIAYGYRFAPIALTAENRVAQAIIGLHLADTALLHIPFGGIHGFFHREAIEIQCGALGINHRAFFGIVAGLTHVGAFDQRDYRQIEMAGESIVAGIVGGYGHDSTGTVARKNIIADPYRNRFSRKRIDGIRATEYTGHAAVDHAFAFGPVAHIVQILVHFRLLVGSGYHCHILAFRSKYHECDTEDGVGPCCKDF